MFITAIRRLRHGPLKVMGPLWLLLGKCYRTIVENIPGLQTSQKIGPYGPFKLDAKFTFSDFESWGGAHNNRFSDCIEESRDTRCVFDIGAHIGLVALPLAQVVRGTVYAFEPAKKNLKHLENHIKYNNIKNIQVVKQLVGNKEENNVKFYEQDQATGMNARVVKKNHGLYHKTLRNQTSIDAFCAKNALVPDIIKIDVEGAEYDVIQGAKTILVTHSPSIYLSIHPHELVLMGASTEMLIQLLKELGYQSFDQEGKVIDEFGFSEYKFIKKNKNEYK